MSIYYDNQVAIHMIENLVLHEKKHMGINCHFIISRVSDIFTKALGTSQFYPLVFKLNLDFYPISSFKGKR